MREQRVSKSERLSSALWDERHTLQIVLKLAMMCQSPPLLHLHVFIDPVWISFLLFLLLLFCLFPLIPTSSRGLPLIHSPPYLHLCLCFSLSAPLAYPSFVHLLLSLLIWQAAILTQRAREWTEFIFLFLSFPWWRLLLHYVHGGDGWEREEGGRGVSQIRTACNHPHFACHYSVFHQLNLSPCPVLSHALPPIKPLHGVCPSRWAGVVWVPGSSQAPSSDAEVWTMGLRWMGLASSNVSLTRSVNNTKGKKKIIHTEKQMGRGSMGGSNLL